MQKQIHVPGISCGHCTATIKREVEEIQGVKQVQADESRKNVLVEWEAPANWEKIEKLLQEIGYPPAS